VEAFFYGWHFFKMADRQLVPLRLLRLELEFSKKRRIPTLMVMEIHCYRRGHPLIAIEKHEATMTLRTFHHSL
jgi:hypothetical protein